MQLGKGRAYIIDKLPRQPVQGHRCRICLRKRSRARPASQLCLAQAQSLDYKQAGVDIDAGAELVRRIQKLNPSIGGFSGLVPFGDSFLVAGTDGVGTKLKLAFDMQTHDTIGIDLVAMSVNDIITSGAKPMFFLDYFATAKLDVDVAESVVKGIVEGCRQSDCALLGGETAEMPGLYQPGEYDVAGFAVGSVKQDRVIDGKQIQEGDVLLALPSSGLHSNGFSLVRKVVEVSGKSLQDPAPWGGAGTLGHALLEPTLIYVKRLLALTDAVHVKGCVHITGGGFTENLPRVMPKGLACRVQTSSWEWPPLFQWLQQAGNIATPEMYRTFNMGVGMVIILPESDVEKALAIDGAGFLLGTVVTGDEVQIV
ncbi:hypothetical protein WJX77_004940 [Trebouxia sp. C0004]